MSAETSEKNWGTMTDQDGVVFGESEISRREVLKGASAGVAASLAATLLSGCAPGPPASRGAPETAAARLSPAAMPQGFSREEMQRRWQRVREQMRERRFDCLLVPERADGNADVKYLTERSAAWVVFPYEGKVTAIGEGDGGGSPGEDIQMRAAAEGLWSKAVMDTLRELGMTQARIGVGNLVNVLRNPEGGVNFTTLDRVRKGLPRAAFEPAVDLLMRVKLVRSPEEIEVLEKATEVSEAGLQAMLEKARPGVMHRELWLHIFQAMANASGELPTRLAIRAGAEANTSQGRPLDEILKPGQILNQELSGTVLGYGSQVNHSVCVGTPAPADWASAAPYCRDLFQSLAAWIAPGKSFQDFLAFYRKKVEERGEGRWGVVFHSGGAGDGPRWGPTRTEGMDLSLAAGMVFTIKPRVPIRGVAAPAAQFGDAVVVTGNGARRLGKRKLEIINLGT